MARPRLPRAEKEIKGTLRKHREPANEPLPKKLESLPPVPETLNDYGRRLWEEAGPELLSIGVITSVDLAAFEQMCIRHGNAMELYDHMTVRTELNKSGKAVKKRIPLSEYMGGRNLQSMPEYSAYRNESQAAITYMINFGMTPASRNKFSVPKDGGKSDAEKKMEGLINA
jgi:P27 family predicted phage terminase small subunit